MGDILMTRGHLGDDFVKGLTAKLWGVTQQVDKDLSLAVDTAMAVENLKSSKLFQMGKTEKAEESFNGISAIGNLQLTKEGQNYPSDDYISTYKTVFRPIEKSLSITATRLQIEDGTVESKIKRTKQLLVSSKRTVNEDTFDVFNTAFLSQTAIATSYPHLTYYGDGVRFCSTKHPIKGLSGQTQSNASSTGMILSEPNLQKALLELQNQRGDKNAERLSIGKGKVVLAVPTTLEKLAQEITGSKLKSDTANNDMNIYRGGNITVMSSDRLNYDAFTGKGSNTHWFLVDTSMTPLMFMNRVPITLIKPFEDKNNGNVTWAIRTRYAIGNTEWKGVWGSLGDRNANTD